MSMKKFAGFVLKVGVLITLAAVLWWAYVYGQMAIDLGSHFTKAVTCLYASGGVCGFAGGLTRLGGGLAYDPLAFWVGIGVLVAGLVLRTLSKR